MLGGWWRPEQNFFRGLKCQRRQGLLCKPLRSIGVIIGLQFTADDFSLIDDDKVRAVRMFATGYDIKKARHADAEACLL